MLNAQAAFPEALPRRLTLPAVPGEPLTLRLKQDFEWTPNGRTYVYIDPVSARIVATNDPADGSTASAIVEKLYPIHSGKVGGTVWKLMLTLCGVALTLLGTLATWSFWFGRRSKPGKQALKPAALARPAE
jgi:uncharacterized iron-regulated membrane protein